LPATRHAWPGHPVLLALVIGGAFLLFAMRSLRALRQGGLFAPVSREGALVLNNLFLATAVGAVLVGTLYPLVLDALMGTTISVGAPFFDLTFGALMAPLLLVLPFGPLLAWKRGDLVAVAQRLIRRRGAGDFPRHPHLGTWRGVHLAGAPRPPARLLGQPSARWPN
jgi:cytochrome c-type biogenesis protein CcmF